MSTEAVGAATPAGGSPDPGPVDGGGPSAPMTALQPPSQVAEALGV